MPELNGFDATRKIRQLEGGRGGHTPIIAMTARAMAGDREQCLAAGTDDHLAKPIKKQQLVEVVEKLGATGVVATSGRRDELLARFDGDTELLRRVSEIFSAQTPQLLDRLRLAVAEKNAAVLQQTAHKFIGSLDAFGAEEAVRSARKIEELAEHKAFERTGEVLTELTTQVETLRSELVSTLTS